MTKLLLTFFLVLLFALPLFAQSVDTAWVRRYHGPGSQGPSGPDEPIAVAVDKAGNVYVTGRSVADHYEYATIKYYPNGDTAWVRRYHGPGNGGDEAFAIAVDSSGNVYVTGLSWGSGTGYDYATIKYYPNGDTAWVRRYNGPGNLGDGATDIAVDKAGNVYVTGYSVGISTGNSDYATIKYYPNGDTAWVRRYNGPGNGHDVALTMALDIGNDVYVTGFSWGSGTGYDYATIMYDRDGYTLGAWRYNSPANDTDFAVAIALVGFYDVYVTGRSRSSEKNYDYLTINYDLSGKVVWVRTYNGPGNDVDIPSGIAFDKAGNVYVTGMSCIARYPFLVDYDYATIKYYPNGDTAWVRRYNDSLNGADGASAIAVDSSGNIYVTGWSWGSTNVYDYATIKYYPDGDTAWVRRYHGPAHGETESDEARAIALDNSGNVYVTGLSANGSGTDYATIKYVQFLRGDANQDKKVNIADVVYLVSYLFKRGAVPLPILQVGDANCDGKVTVSDVVYLVAYLFKHGPVPCI